jgi:hypothetical protein
VIFNGTAYLVREPLATRPWASYAANGDSKTNARLVVNLPYSNSMPIADYRQVDKQILVT